MKSKEEILQDAFGSAYYWKHAYLREDIFKAMEEYAAQFRPASSLPAQQETEETIIHNLDMIHGGPCCTKCGGTKILNEECAAWKKKKVAPASTEETGKGECEHDLFFGHGPHTCSKCGKHFPGYDLPGTIPTIPQQPEGEKEDAFKNRVAQIMRDNITFSGQVGDYIIHGALDEIWKLHLEYASTRELKLPSEGEINKETAWLGSMGKAGAKWAISRIQADNK